MHKSTYYIIGLTIVLIGISVQTGVFWDNVTFVSVAGKWLYQHGWWQWFTLPDQVDSGHPLLPAMWCAMVWKWVGRSLLITHISLAPFVFLTLYYLWRILQSLFDTTRYQIIAFVIALADGTLLSQLVLIGPEVFLLCFFMMALYGLLSRDEVRLSIGLALLGLVSMRGMMLCLGLWLTDCCLYARQQKRTHWFSYLIGAMPAVTFLIARLMTKGWIIANPLHPWGEAFAFESVGDFVRNMVWNIAVIGFRYVDFGRIVLWGVLCVLIGTDYRSLLTARSRKLFLLAFLPVSVVLVTSLIIRNPVGHRYFTVSYIFVSFWVLSMLEHRRLYAYGVVAIGLCLVAGNGLVYPASISQGWDASLAHWPYWQVRRQTIAQMDSAGIDVAQTASFFPAGGCIDDIELNGDRRSFAVFNEVEPLPEYVFYTNVSNLSDEQLQLLHDHYQPVIRNRKWWIDCEVLRLQSMNQP